jgi:long-chain acyl-CoA synthetase
VTGARDRTLCSLLESWGGRGDRPAIVAFRNGRSETWSYARVAAAARNLSFGLAARGIGRLEPVVICARNAPEWVVAYFGILRAGALPVPVNDLASATELAQILAACGARRVFTTSRHAATFRTLRTDLEIVLLDGEGEGGWRNFLNAPATKLPQLKGDEPASLLWTSGTTGVPKGVPLTHRNFIANIDALLSERIADERDRLLLPLPLHHAYPFTVGMLLAFGAGATVIFPSGITGPEISRAIRDGRATAVIGVPRLYAALFDAVASGAKARGRGAALLFKALLNLSLAARRYGLPLGRILFAPLRAKIGPDLRKLASGGARLDPEIGTRLEALGFEVLPGYGLTETAPMLTMTVRGRARMGTEGQAAPGVELEVAPEPGQPFGEILAKGPNVFSGYWKNEAATRAAFTPEGWFRTGDLGFLDADGYLHITGRKSEMIRLPGGENVFPEEIETAYGASPVIHEIAVLEERGKLMALVVPDEDFIRARGAARIGALLREELETAGSKLASFRRISGFAVTQEALPRTHLGKLKRHLLPELYAQAVARAPAAAEAPPSEADRKILAEPLGAAVHDWLARRYPGRRVNLDSMLQIDLGIDSLEWVTLTLELQAQFGVALTEERLSRIVTLRDLIGEVQAAKAAGPSKAVVVPAIAMEVPETSRWLRPRGPVLRALALAIYYGNRAVMRTAFRLTAEGLENLPAAGPFVLAPNHASLLDPFLVAAALPFRSLRHAYWAGWTGRLFSNPLLRIFSRTAKVVPVDPERDPAEGLAFGLTVLGRGEALVWFPEGRRTRTGEIGPFLRGVGYLLAHTGVSAVPVHIVGSLRAKAWRSRVTVVVGKPLGPAQLEAAGAGPDLFARIADGLRGAVAALGPAGRPGESRPPGP